MASVGPTDFPEDDERQHWGRTCNADMLKGWEATDMAQSYAAQWKNNG